jgi:hypothetical protein
MIEIDHGNGLLSRYAHTSQILVKEGDLVMRGQRVATWGRPAVRRSAPAFRSAAERRSPESCAIPPVGVELTARRLMIEGVRRSSPLVFFCVGAQT